MTLTAQHAAADAVRVAVSTVIFSVCRHDAAPGERASGGSPAKVVLPLVRRTRDPFEGRWALPGGWLDVAEDLDTAAARTLAETTGLAPTYLEQLYAFGALNRSPDRVVSIVYWALVRDGAHESAPEHNVDWFDANDLPDLAFDHTEIVDYALWRLRNKVGYSRIAQGLLPEEFTMGELREVYEAILGQHLDPANFRRQAEGSGTLIPTERFRTGSHRPARLYRYDRAVELADRGPLPG